MSPFVGAEWTPSFLGDRRWTLNEKHITLGCLAAYGLWSLSLALLVTGTVVGLLTKDETLAMVIMAHALVCSAAAATATIRRFFVYQNKMVRNAFELGRDSADSRVARMR